MFSREIGCFLSIITSMQKSIPGQSCVHNPFNEDTKENAKLNQKVFARNNKEKQN